MKFRYDGANIGPVQLNELDHRVSITPSGINVIDSAPQNRLVDYNPSTVVELQDTDGVIRSYNDPSSQLRQLIDSGKFTVVEPPLSSSSIGNASYAPAQPADWQVPPPTTIVEALDQAGDIASSYRDGTATSIKLMTGSNIGDATHRVGTLFADNFDASTLMTFKVGGAVKFDIGTSQARFYDSLKIDGTLTLGTLSGVLKAAAGLVSGSATTSDLPEGTNLYFTQQRARLALSGTANRITLNTGTGVIDIDPSYIGQTSISQLGNVTTGTWSATTISAIRGGTGLTTYTLGDIIYSSAANALSALPGNSTTTRKFLRQVGTGSASAAPVWDTLIDADLNGTSVITGSRNVNTTSPLTGGGSLSSDRTLSITGLSSLGSGNQMVGVNSGATGWEYKTLNGTSSQVIVAHGSGSITLSLPQNIHVGASPTFVGLSLSGIANNRVLFMSAGAISSSAGFQFDGTNLSLPADPTSGLHAATKQYVDNVAQGLDVKGSVRVATVSNISLSGTQTVDGVALTVGDRVLVKNQTLSEQNGIYVVASGAWTRAADADTSNKVTSGMFTFVEAGNSHADTGWVLTTDISPIVVGTTPISFSQFSGSGMVTGGAGLTQSGSTLHVGTASSSRIVVNADDIDLANSGVAPGTYTKLTVDIYGRVTSGSSILMSDITTALGYTPLSDTGGAISGNLIINGLTVNQAVFTNGSKQLVSNAITGSGNVVMSNSPTLTGTTTIANLSMSGSFQPGTDYLYPNAEHLLHSNSTVGNDNARLVLMGGGSYGRGGEIYLGGNNSGDPGRVLILTGNGSNGYVQIGLSDNVSGAFRVTEGVNNYLWLDTTNGTEQFSIGTKLLMSDKITLAAAAATRPSMNMPAGTAPSSPSTGDMWSDITQKSLTMVGTSGLIEYKPGVIWVKTATNTVSNTLTETSVFDTGVGIKSLPGGFFSVGKTIRIKLFGSFKSDPGSQATIKLKLGGSNVINSSSISSGTAERSFIAEFMITCRSIGISGTVFAQGTLNNIDQFTFFNSNTSAVNTNNALALDVSAQWNVTSSNNALTVTNAMIEVLM